MRFQKTLFLIILLLLLSKFMTYVDSGYNEFLEHPLVISAEQSALDFDALIESGAITTEQLAKGIMAELVDEDGNIIINQSGLTKNAITSGTQVMRLGNKNITGDSVFHSLEELTISFNVKTSATVFVVVNLTIFVDGNQANPEIRFWIDNSEFFPDTLSDKGVSTLTYSGIYALSLMKEFETGDHTITPQVARSSPDSTVQVKGWSKSSGEVSWINYIVFGN